ncbi:hypothetical protein [Prevotella sp.]|uniref:hypothetical protein n=1 Tax=Prevotella sp. TaxID=59823 RepID=UPI00307CBB19
MEEQKIRRALFLSVSDYENEIRKVLKKPFMQDGKLCASNGSWLVRIDPSLCDTHIEFAVSEKPSLKNLFPAKTCSQIITKEAINEAVEEIPTNVDDKCQECYGEGTVIFTYIADTDGEEYEIEDTCPICDGSGKCKKGKEIVTKQEDGVVLCGKIRFSTKQLMWLERVVDALGVDSVVKVSDKDILLLTACDGKVEILITTVHDNYNNGEVDVRLG